MTDVVLIRISWPVPALWQNSRVHRAEKARAVAAYRKEAWARACEQTVARVASKTARLRFFFHPPDRRKRDLHNMPATMKAAIDGIADAMGVDDNSFRCAWPEEFSEVVKGGCVLIEITK